MRGVKFNEFVRGVRRALDAVDGDLLVEDGEIEAKGGLRVTGTTVCQGDCRFIGDVTTRDLESRGGDAVFEGNLTASGEVKARGPLDVRGDLKADTLDARKRVDVHGSLDVQEASVGGSLTVARDLIFMSPSLMDDLASGSVWTIYLTAGDAGLGEDYWRGREEGERAAYSAMGTTSWSEDALVVNGKRLASSVSRNARLMFIHLPDGGRLDPKEVPVKALERIWNGEELATVDGANRFDREALIAMLSELIRTAGGGLVSTHDPTGWTAGCDHIDHLYTGLFAIEAARRAGAG